MDLLSPLVPHPVVSSPIITSFCFSPTNTIATRSLFPLVHVGVMRSFIHHDTSIPRPQPRFQTHFEGFHVKWPVACRVEATETIQEVVPTGEPARAVKLHSLV